MKSSVLGGVLFLVCLPTWSGRDPFAPPQARCQLHQADLWRYGGSVKQGESIRVLLQKPEKTWLRVSPGAMLATGWQVIRADTTTVTLKNGEGCRPSVLVWTLKDRQHDKDIPSFIITRHDSRTRGTAESQHVAGGG